MAKIMCTVLEYLKLALYKALLDIYTYIVEPFHIITLLLIIIPPYNPN